MSLEVWPGRPEPLGASYDGQGVNFAVFAEDATGVDLCLFDQPETHPETQRIAMRTLTGRVWYTYVVGAQPGQLYGFRVSGPYAPHRGLRFNHTKLLLDPYSRAVTGRIRWGQSTFDYDFGSLPNLTPNSLDSAPDVPRSVVVDTLTPFDWQNDRPPGVPLADTIVYETHVKGLTRLHPDVPPALQGTYAGLATPPIVQYLTSLGVTTIELLPVQEFVDDQFLVQAGRVNYWGYQPIAHFSPAARYSSSGDRGQQVTEFKELVRALHAAGLEVVLDVVYNHTAEGNHLGPALGFRGIDNPAYYVLSKADAQYYVDVTGVGNTFNVDHRQTLKLVTDSLRYWVQEMHVDGFRFDLAAVLGLDQESGQLNFDKASRFFDTVYQDPTLSKVKLFAEPWAASGYYELGQFPPQWSEWNGRYRDTLRRFWKGDSDQIADLANRVTGSHDPYGFELDGRGPLASVNLVTVHDGLTLRDLVSCNTDSSWDCTAPGWTDAQVESLRGQQQRNFLASMLLSTGIPLVLGGDEIGRTQQGNANGYDQDNPTSWYDWDLSEADRALLDYVRQTVALRKAHPVLRRTRFFDGTVQPSGIEDLAWFRPDGARMGSDDWSNGNARAIGLRLAGDAAEPDSQGQPRTDDALLILLNAWWGDLQFTLPAASRTSVGWEVELDTSQPTDPATFVLPVGGAYPLQARSLAVLRARAA